jgi:predicted metal-dependent HD superfamily phosphohydrolase
MKHFNIDNWSILCQKIPIFEGIEEEFNNILEHYSKDARFYHNGDHIDDCMGELYDFNRTTEAKKVRNPIALELAIVFHDIIYDTHNNDNEEKSAEYSEDFLIANHNKGHNLVLSTKKIILATSHKNPPKTYDEAVAIDIDLSIFGQDEKKFNSYDQNIRKEYSWVEEDKYKQGRTKILQGFLDRSKATGIYCTDYFKNKHGTQARNNLQRAIERLKV